jgi:hypothetical protein
VRIIGRISVLDDDLESVFLVRGLATRGPRANGVSERLFGGDFCFERYANGVSVPEE